jgi:hypothetical protein
VVAFSMSPRQRIARIVVVGLLVWAGAAALHAGYRAWRTLPPYFERIPGALRWHDREARRLRAFVEAAEVVAPAAAGVWCWDAPHLPERRRGEIRQWVAFLAPAHEVWDAREAPPGLCAFAVTYLGAATRPPAVGALELEHRFGTVERLGSP